MKSSTKRQPSPKSKSGSSKSSGKSKDKVIKEEKLFETADEDDHIPENLEPPPPPRPPKPSPLANIKRQIHYPSTNSSTLVHIEPFWSPTYPLCTSWGEIWIAQRPYRKIQRYKYDIDMNKLIPQGDPIVTKGEPKMMLEIPQTGRIAIVLNCPTAKRTTIAFYNPETYAVEHKIDYPYMIENSENQPSVVDPESMDPLPRSFNLEDDSTPYGICANSYSICILFKPIQRMQFLDSNNYSEQNFHLKNYCQSERSCIHLAPSGACALSDTMLFLAASNPSRIEAFSLHYRRAHGIISGIDVLRYASFGIDRFTYSEPFGIQLDSLGLLVANDGSAGIFHVFNVDFRPSGPCQPSLPHAEICCLGSWRIDRYECVRSGYFSLAKNGIAAIVDRDKNALHIIADLDILRCYRDALSYDVGSDAEPLKVEQKEIPCECALEDTWEPIPDDELLPESWIRKYITGESNEPEEKETGKSKSKKSSKSDKSSKKSSSTTKSSNKSSKSSKDNKKVKAEPNV